METSLSDFRTIQEIPLQYQSVFQGYPCFNIVQSTVLDVALKTDNSLVVSAPTGSGKTAIFEMAIIRHLMLAEESENTSNNKIIYICPIKALCKERLIDWHKKFADFGLKCISVTSDNDDIDVKSIYHYNVIITTPEKWDVLTRRWRSNSKAIGVISLFLIDEVHLLNADTRGSTLEVIVSRMKTAVASLMFSEEKSSIRFIALSATIPNIEDIAEWIEPSGTAKHFKFSEEVRPVQLNKIVMGYYLNPQSQSIFKFDMSLNYKLTHIISKYSEGKPTLIFCNTRKSVEMTAKHLVSNLQIRLSQEQKEILVNISQQLSDLKLKQYIVHGIAFHHAGLVHDNRHTIEESFRNGCLPILVTTSTLAMGVNLPAHLVIIKSTKHYSDGGYKDYDEVSIFQMIGRAGRSQFDLSATAVILTSLQDKMKYERMLGCSQTIESNLHKHLTEHLNAEVVLKTITDLEVAMRWLSSTFLYVRARRSPEKYKLPQGLSKEKIDKKLLEMCQIDLNKLVRAGMIKMNQAIEVSATVVGEIMAKYYVAFDTMKLFTQIQGAEIMIQILAIISKCKEFSEIYLRANDKRCLNMLNKSSNKESNRFPLTGRIKTIDMKVNCIIQAVLGNLEIHDQSILCDSTKIMRNCERLANCLIEYLETRDKCYSALLNTIILAKCFRVKLWENSPYVSKQLPGVGQVISTLLTKAGKNSFQEIASTNPRQLELIVGRRAPFGSTLVEEATRLPQYKLTLEKHGNATELVLTLLNPSEIEQKSTISLDSIMTLLVGDSENNILLYEKYAHNYMLENPEVKRSINIGNQNLDFIKANLISENWVGIDSTCKLELSDKPPSDNGNQNKKAKQTYMDMYMQHVKKSNAYKKKIENNVISKENSSFAQKSDLNEVNKKLPTNIIENNAKEHNEIIPVVQVRLLDKKHKHKRDDNNFVNKSSELLTHLEVERNITTTDVLEGKGAKCNQSTIKELKNPKKKNIIIAKSIFRTESKIKHDKKKQNKSDKITFLTDKQAKIKMNEIRVKNDVMEEEFEGNISFRTDYSNFEKKYDKLFNKSKDKKELANNSKNVQLNAIIPLTPKVYTRYVSAQGKNERKIGQESDLESECDSESNVSSRNEMNEPVSKDLFQTPSKHKGTKLSGYDKISKPTTVDSREEIKSPDKAKAKNTYIETNKSETRESIENETTATLNDNKYIFNEDKFNSTSYEQILRKYTVPADKENDFENKNQNQSILKNAMDNPDSTGVYDTYQATDLFLRRKRQSDENSTTHFEVFPQKSIKWRSPLVYSPPEKFSPRRKDFCFEFVERKSENYKEDTRESNELRQGTQSSGSSMTSTEKAGSQSNTYSGKSQKKKRKYQFPLSDQDYMEDENDSFIKNVKDLDNLCDLEYFGLSKRKESVKKPASSTSYVGKYYSQLLMNSQGKPDSTDRKSEEISQAKNVPSHQDIKTARESLQKSQDIFSESDFLPSSKDPQSSKSCQMTEARSDLLNEHGIKDSKQNMQSPTQPEPRKYYHNHPTTNFPRRNVMENIDVLRQTVPIVPKSGYRDYSDASFSELPIYKRHVEDFPQRRKFNPYLDEHRYSVRTSPYFIHQPSFCERRPEMSQSFSLPATYPLKCCGRRPPPCPTVNPYCDPYHETIPASYPYYTHTDNRYLHRNVPSYRSPIDDIQETYLDYCLQQVDEQPSHIIGSRNTNAFTHPATEFCHTDNFITNMHSAVPECTSRSILNYEASRGAVPYEKENINPHPLGQNQTHFKFRGDSFDPPIFENVRETKTSVSENELSDLPLSRRNVSQIFAPTPKPQVCHNSSGFNLKQNQKAMMPKSVHAHASLSANAQRQMRNLNSFEERLDMLTSRSQDVTFSTRDQNYDQPAKYNRNSDREYAMNRFMFENNQNYTQ